MSIHACQCQCGSDLDATECSTLGVNAAGYVARVNVGTLCMTMPWRPRFGHMTACNMWCLLCAYRVSEDWRNWHHPPCGIRRLWRARYACTPNTLFDTGGTIALFTLYKRHRPYMISATWDICKHKGTQAKGVPLTCVPCAGVSVTATLMGVTHRGTPATE